MTAVEHAVAIKLTRSGKHHCYTEGLTIQRANYVGWVCLCCGKVVENLNDANVTKAFSDKTAKDI